jgi:hypothetical protein
LKLFKVLDGPGCRIERISPACILISHTGLKACSIRGYALTLRDNHFPTAALESTEIYSNLVDKRASYRIDLCNVTLKAESIDVIRKIVKYKIL